jgi:transcriptional regulator with XRE-family HTH domain
MTISAGTHRLGASAKNGACDLFHMPNRIKELRLAAGHTLKSLADLVGTSLQQIQRLENSKRRLTEDWMIRIGDALGVPPTSLMQSGGGTLQNVREFARNDGEAAMLVLLRGLSDQQRAQILLDLVQMNQAGRNAPAQKSAARGKL